MISRCSWVVKDRSRIRQRFDLFIRPVGTTLSSSIRWTITITISSAA